VVSKLFTDKLLTGSRAIRLAKGKAPCEYRSRHIRRTLSNTVQEYFKNDTLALIGYGSQGHGQGLNLRDNGLNVIVGVRKNGQSWKEAQQDGWIPGTNLFDVDEAISKGTIIMNLLSDAAQSETWPAIKPQLTKGKVGLSRKTCRIQLLTLADPLLLSRLLPCLQRPDQSRRTNRHRCHPCRSQRLRPDCPLPLP